jgi:hypothetical protein
MPIICPCEDLEEVPWRTAEMIFKRILKSKRTSKRILKRDQGKDRK